jgi:hypothetical protein
MKLSADSNIACNNTDMLSRLPAPETTYKGYIPDGVTGGMAGQFMVSMVPVGTCFDCSSVSHVAVVKFNRGQDAT